jgi:predicted nucleotidyltransferase
VFGSYARGEATEESDVDVAVIASADKANRKMLIESRVALRETLRGTGLAIDFVLQSTERFESARQECGSLQQVIASEGQVIYERC